MKVFENSKKIWNKFYYFLIILPYITSEHLRPLHKSYYEISFFIFEIQTLFIEA